MCSQLGGEKEEELNYLRCLQMIASQVNCSES